MTEKLLHVFGGQGKRGVLDLSQYESQNVHFVSEDLEIKSNTPQVSKNTRTLFDTTLLQKKRISWGNSRSRTPNINYVLCVASCVHAV